MLKTNPIQLVDHERRFRLLIDAVVDYAVYMLDLDGIVVTWNPGAERIKGYMADEIIGQSFERFFTPEDRHVGRPRVALDIARRVGRYESEGWRLRRDGTRFWALAVIDAIRDPSGQVIGFAKVTRDMTEQRATQEALWESERRFRLLVNAVVDYGLFMLDTDGTVIAWNSGAERAKGYTAGEIIGQHFSRFYTEEDRGRGLPARALETAVRDGKFETEGWRVRKDGTQFWARVLIEPVRDEVGELIGFAKITRDMTEQRAAERKLDETREALHQAQKMEALGQLTSEVAKHAFEPFFTTKEIGKGTGLGLSMVYGAMRQIGGDAALESEPGRGTTVRLYIPAGAAAGDPVLERAAADPITSNGHGVPLLLVEDDPIVSMATVEMLETAGYRVHVANRGDAAVRILEEHPEIGLLVTDVGLPGMNGHEVAAQGRSRRPDLHVLFITGYDRSGIVGEAASRPGTAYLSKPYQPDDLFQALRQFASPSPAPGD